MVLKFVPKTPHCEKSIPYQVIDSFDSLISLSLDTIHKKSSTASMGKNILIIPTIHLKNPNVESQKFWDFISEINDVCKFDGDTEKQSKTKMQYTSKQTPLRLLRPL